MHSQPSRRGNLGVSWTQPRRRNLNRSRHVSQPSRESNETASTEPPLGTVIRWKNTPVSRKQRPSCHPASSRHLPCWTRARLGIRQLPWRPHRELRMLARPNRLHAEKRFHANASDSSSCEPPIDGTHGYSIRIKDYTYRLQARVRGLIGVLGKAFCTVID